MSEIGNPETRVENLLGGIGLPIARVLDKSLSGIEVSVDDGELLFDAKGKDLVALSAAADELRRRTNGDVVTYVVNRNINFTNVCIKRCGFCAFSRDHRQEQGYFLPLNEIIRRAKEAYDLGATEVCIQAGLPPKMDGSLYIDLASAIKKEIPDMHIHGFSPEEILYGAVRSKCEVEQYLLDLKSAGVGSLPGTSAEILDQDVRDRIAPGRISVRQWVDVVTTAHKVGIPTTSTIMFGHLETNRHRAAHLALLRDIQKDTGGFTEFVPLSFIHEEAPMFVKQRHEEMRPGATGADVVRMHAIARIMLTGWIENIQCSWVKEGPKLAQLLLSAGCNDLGGTLINESISTAAGASYGQLATPSEIRSWIRDAGRIPIERTTLYGHRRSFEFEPEQPESLDIIKDQAEQLFGSYHQLVNLAAWRYEGQRAPSLEGPTWDEVTLSTARSSEA